VAAPAQREATGTDGIARPDARSPTDQPHLRLEPAFESTVGPPPPHSRADARSAGLKVHRPMDGTLQFLPGRLEVVEGRDVGQEIRFVRLPGTQETEVTLGRADGPAYRHVQLHEPTVSRMHAKMTLEGKRWRLTNLSRTNPVVVNGAPLEPDGASVVLSDGDRVEMGEVACRFRAK
jgi:pSer/pThr/pTyr-binding forkhead associated (FHA) protein